MRLLCRAALACFLSFVSGSAIAGSVTTKTVLSVSSNPVVEGAYDTLTATVTASSGVPTGSVNITVNSEQVLTITLSNGKGSAQVPTGGIAEGTYSVTGSYTGSSEFAASQGSVSVLVLSPVSLSAQAVPNPVVVGQNATLHSTVTATDGGGTPGGTVQYYVGSELIGQGTLSGGQTTLSVSTAGQPAGTYPITAKYLGDSTHGAGSGTINVTLQAPGGTACGTGHEGLLKGQYVFEMTGYRSGAEIPYFTAGSFAADGTGKVTGGEQDLNFFQSAEHVTVLSYSQYSVGPDGRGCLTLATSDNSTRTYRFSLIAVGEIDSGVSGGGRIIEFDDTNGGGTRATGGMAQANTSEYSLADLEPNYSFDLLGFQQNGSYERTAMVGTFAVSSTGVLSSGEADTNYNGVTELAQTLSSGTLGAIDSYGRATLTFSVDAKQYAVAAYMVNKAVFFLVGTAAGAQGTAMDGEMRSADTGFTSTNVLPTYVEHVSGEEPNGSGYEQALALTRFSAGNYSTTRYELVNGAASTVADSGTYAISANGRLVMNSVSGGQPEIIYLQYRGVSAGKGAFVLGLQSPIATSGSADSQTAETYSDSVLAGSYGLGEDIVLLPGMNDSSGELTLSSSGAVSGTADESGEGGLDPAVDFSLGGPLDFDSGGVSSASGLVGIATGSNIYVLQEGSVATPILDFTVNVE